MDVESIEIYLLPLYKKNWIIVVIYVIAIFTALISNFLVILVVVKDQTLRNVTNYFLVNLALADLLVTFICMPNSAYAAYTAIYIFGEYACKISAYLQCVAVALSIFTITAMATDRYFAIIRPFGYCYRCFNKKSTAVLIAFLWMLAFVIFSPILVVMETKKVFPNVITIREKNTTLSINAAMCVEEWSHLSTTYNMQKIWGVIWFVVMFVIPGLIIFFAYSMMCHTLCVKTFVLDQADGAFCNQMRNRVMRARRRVACILLVLAAIFTACWLPYHVLCLIDDLKYSGHPGQTAPTIRHWQLKEYLLLLGHINSMLNPLIYTILSKRFRNSVWNTVSVIILTLRRRHSGHQNICLIVDNF